MKVLIIQAIAMVKPWFGVKMAIIYVRKIAPAKEKPVDTLVKTEDLLAHRVVAVI